MATYDQIYDVQSAIETAATYILSASCGIAHTYTSRNNSNKETPSAEVQFSLGAPIGHTAIVSGSVVFDAWSGNLSVMIVSDRAVNNVSHSLYVDRTRRHLQNEALWYSGSILPNHVCFRSTNTNTLSQIDEEMNLDVTAMTFEQMIFVKPNAWP